MKGSCHYGSTGGSKMVDATSVPPSSLLSNQDSALIMAPESF